jgi:hypothetical protein
MYRKDEKEGVDSMGSESTYRKKNTTEVDVSNNCCPTIVIRDFFYTKLKVIT